MRRLIDPVLFAFERLWQHRILVFWTLLGLSAATTLALSLTLYVDAVNTDLLTDKLGDPPYAFRFRYLGSWEGAIAPADVDRATETLDNAFVDAIGLPTTRTARYISGGNWNVTRQGDVPVPFGTYTLGTLKGAGEQIQITSGQWPPTDYTGDAVVPDRVAAR
jgi:putative ABC transport system permease protein